MHPTSFTQLKRMFNMAQFQQLHRGKNISFLHDWILPILCFQLVTLGETDFFLWKRREIQSYKRVIKNLCSWIVLVSEVCWILQKPWRRENGFGEIIAGKSERRVMKIECGQHIKTHKFVTVWNIKIIQMSLWIFSTNISKYVAEDVTCVGIQRGRNNQIKWGSTGLWFKS